MKEVVLEAGELLERRERVAICIEIHHVLVHAHWEGHGVRITKEVVEASIVDGLEVHIVVVLKIHELSAVCCEN